MTSLQRFAPPIWQFLLALTLLGLLPLAAVTAISIHFAHEEQHRNAARATLDLARAVASAAEAELGATIWALQVLAASDALRRDDLAAMHQELSRFTAARADIAAMSLADNRGQVLLRTSEPVRATPRQAIEPATLARTLETKRPQVGPLVSGPRGEFVYAVRVPVLVDEEVRYVLTAGVRPDRLREILDHQQRPPDWVISIFDSQGRRMARSRDHDRQIGGLPSPTLASLLSGSPSGEGVGSTTNLEGEEFVTAFSRSPSSNWTVVIGSPVHDLESFFRRSLGHYAVGVGGSLLVSLVLAALLWRLIQTDIRQVVQRAKQIGTGREPSGYSPRTAEIAEVMGQVEVADQRVREALDEAARAGAAKDQFLAVLGHELRNPLAPISNVLAILERKCGDDTARERQILRRQIMHMVRLVDDLLDVSRLVEGKLRFKREVVDVVDLVAEAAETFRQQHGTDQIEIRLPTVPCRVFADPIRLVQVITNLIVNAARHGAGRPISIEVHNESERVRVVVTDRGEGMATETLARVFEPFYQGQSNGGSLGLGLAIVKGIVEQHGGAVTADSPGLGRGSSFEFTLPPAL